MLTLGLSALIVAGAAAGTTVMNGGAAVASALDAFNLKQAASDAARAKIALSQGKVAKAIAFAESAVRYSPQDASYRALLGNAYIKAGRFASARDAFTDSLALSPADAPTALSLALAQTATGDWASARKTLDDHADIIAIADRGLALALAGDPDTAVEMLTAAARGPQSDPKTRQNLALALALAGRWLDAKTVAAVDVSPAELDKRMAQWALFARPNVASDQVATLLGVRAVQDSGQPVSIALNAQVPTQAVAAVNSVAAPEPVAPAEVATTVDEVKTSEPAPVEVAAAAPATTKIVFGERKPVVQALPASYVAYRAKTKMVPTRVAAAVRPSAPVAALVSAPASGNFYVQLGAFENVAVAQDGWSKATRRLPRLAAHSPAGAPIKTAAGSFYRLSIGGFARNDAVSLCNAYRAKGGNCFVRTGAGDQVASWVKSPRQLASR